MENYKKKYEEALEKARKINSGEGVAAPPDWTACEVIFPELRESKDEKIRKELIERFKWELKGAEEQDAAGCSRQKDIAMFKRGIAWLEKQGEQKPTDKVEPKFKVGDWITNGEYTWKVTDIKPLDYILQSQAGSVVSDDVSYVDEHFHLRNAWSEEDEKMLNKIIDELTPYGECPDYPSPEEQEYYYTRQEMIDWLKSLKPRWKPTEEQMEALKKRTHGLHKSSETRKTLESLINDLKKL